MRRDPRNRRASFAAAHPAVMVVHVVMETSAELTPVLFRHVREDLLDSTGDVVRLGERRHGDLLGLRGSNPGHGRLHGRGESLDRSDRAGEHVLDAGTEPRGGVAA